MEARIAARWARYRARISSRQRIAIALLSLIPVSAVLIFALMHSGSRATTLCEGEGFSGTGSLSWWPPGARCVGGEPAIEKTVLDPACFFAAGTLTLILLGAAAIALPARREPRP
jgi:hypothetical protein